MKFELTRSGVIGVGVVCFCIFLWMFLLGVWAGQTMLLPPIQDRGVAVQAAEGGTGKNVPHIEADARKKIFKK